MNPDPGPSNQDVAGRSRNGVGRTRRCHLDGALLHTRSVPVAPPDDGIEELEVLRRFDGSSVYTLAGPTSTHRQESLTPRSLVATAGRRGGATVDDTAIDLAFSRWRRTAPP